MVVSYLDKPMGPVGQKTMHLAILCLGGYCILTGGLAALEDRIPRPSRRTALRLETGASAFVALPDQWRPACKAIQLHESMIDKALDRRPVFAESGTVLEAAPSKPPAPQCSGPVIHLNTKFSIKSGAWASQEYYLTAGSEWTYAIVSSELVTVLHMTAEGFGAWQTKRPRWGQAAADLTSEEPRPQGILGAHHVQPRAAESRSWRVDEEGRYVLVMLPSYAQGAGSRAVVRVGLDLRVSRTAYCRAGASVSSTQGDGAWMELSEDTAGFIVHVPQPDHSQTKVVKDYFRCRIEDDNLEKYAALVYSDLVRGGVHVLVIALVLLIFAATHPKMEPVIVPGLEAPGAGASGALQLQGGRAPAGASAMVTEIAEIMKKKRQAEIARSSGSVADAEAKKTR